MTIAMSYGSVKQFLLLLFILSNVFSLKHFGFVHNTIKFQKCYKNMRLYDKINSEKVENQSRPPIIPFDDDAKKKRKAPEGVDEFARNDMPIKALQEVQQKISKTLTAIGGTGQSTVNKRSEQQNDKKERGKRISALTNTERDGDGNIITNADDLRPSGYDNDDYDPNDEPNYPPSFIDGKDPDISVSQEPSNALLQFLQDTVIESPYDSNNKKQAKFVVRSITALSFAIGLVFTVVWYAFPGKFISYREGKDFTARYPAVYMDPDQLLSNDSAGMTLFDDPAVKMPSNSDENSKSINKGENTNNDELTINREIQRFLPEKNEYDKYFAKPTIEL